MLGALSKCIKDVSILRRLIFAVAQLPKDLPNLWDVAVGFATHGKQSALTAEQAKVLVENMQELDAQAFSSDEDLRRQLIGFQVPRSKPLGILLVSSNEKCLLCASKLQLRRDRSALIVIYDDIMGTVPGSHFHKYCSSRACGFVQYYGYYTTGLASSEVVFNKDWNDLPFFVSSRETAFSMRLLHRFNAQIVMGQLSFKQCADVYNFFNNYPQQSDVLAESQ